MIIGVCYAYESVTMTFFTVTSEIKYWRDQSCMMAGLSSIMANLREKTRATYTMLNYNIHQADKFP